MRRRLLLTLPLTAVVAAALGTWLAGRPLLAAAVAAFVGLAAAVTLILPLQRRIDRLAGRVLRLPDGDDGGADAPLGAEWRRVLAALDVVRSSLHERVDDVAAARARMLRLLEGLPPGILLFTSEGLAYANAAARALFGLTAAEARTPMQVLGVQALADAVAEAGETGGPVSVEVSRDDRELIARASVVAPHEVALVVTDVTDMRRVEAVRRDFVTNASHELKTPVAGIKALAESIGLALRSDPMGAQRMVARMEREAARLAQLVRDLLDLARLEEATAERGRRVDLCDVVRVEVDHVRPLAAQRRVAIECELPDEAVLVAVPEDLRVIVGNLLENAVLYNGAGGSVWVSVHRQDAVVVLDVADNGIGIPDADRDRVFERFYRVDKGRSRAAGGTGLGLSLVRHAAERHGGHVSLSSVLGEGSTFRVELPVEGAAALRP